MNPRIKKEIRSLLPSFAVTVAGTILTAVLFDGREGWNLVSIVFGGGGVMLGACSFGNEFYTRTMTSLLSQPISRHRLWFEKLLVLGGMLAVGYGVWFFSVAVLCRGEARPENLTEVPLTMLLVPVLVLCSAPVMALKARNVLGAMAATVMAPMGILVMIAAVDSTATYICSRPELFLAGSFARYPGFYVAGLALGYSALAYWAGWATFMKFESLDSQGQEVRFPARLETVLGLALKRVVPGYTGPFASLVRKELELQRLGFMLAGLLCVWLPIAAVVWKIHPGDLTAALIIAPFAIYVLIIPLITGVVCVAEERNLGISAWQFTLPPSGLLQWRAKMLVALGTCVGLGVVLPLMLLILGTALFDKPVDTTHIEPYVLLLVLYLTLFSLVIYSSSISTNSIRAVLAYLGLLCGAGAVAFAARFLVVKVSGLWNFPPLIDYRAIRNWLLERQTANATFFDIYLSYLVMGLICLFLCALMLWFFKLASSNYRKGELNPQRVKWQMVWLLAVVCVLSVAANAVGFVVQKINEVPTAQFGRPLG